MKRMAALAVLVCWEMALATVIDVPADHATIQGAILASVDGDTVLVAPGTYAENIRFYGKAILLKSSAGRDSTTIVAVEASAVVQFYSGEDSTSILRGFTVDGADISLGFWVNFSSPIVEYCDVRNCRGDGNGSAFACLNGSRAEIRHNLIHDNSSGDWYGTAIWGWHSNLEITGNVIYANTGQMPGIMLTGGPSRVWNNVLYGNTSFFAPWGAAIWCQGDGHEIINNTVAGNVVGVECVSGTGWVLNNLVTGNLYDGLMAPGSFTVDYNDVWNNGSSNDPGPNGISADPLFADSASADYRLLAGSPCINSGDPSLRYDDPDGTRCDIGRWPYDSSYAYPRPLNRNLGADSRQNVVNHTPTFYWSFTDTALGTTQTAYEVEVGTDTDWTAAEMWATAVAVADTFAVYSGSALLDGGIYFMRMRVNNGTIWGDWLVLQFSMNVVPSDPQALVPVNGTKLPLAHARLTVENATDTPYEVIRYTFGVYQDSALTVPIEMEVDVSEQPGLTHSSVLASLLEGVNYWWRARAYDGFEYSGWTPVSHFVTRPPGGTLSVPADAPGIQFAINLAVPSDTVVVGPGTYLEHVDFLGKSVLLTSWSGSESTVIQSVTAGVPVVRFVTAEDSQSVLRGFTIDGASQSRGIHCSGSGPVIEDCEIRFAQVGGNGGGITCLEGSTAKIRNNRIHHNTATQIGGAIYAANSPLEVFGNEIYDNTGMRPGIGLVSGPSSIRKNEIHHNIGSEPKWAAGIWIQGDGHDVSNNSVVKNTVGIASNTGTSTIQNNVVAYNTHEGLLDEGLALVDYNITWENGSANGPGVHGSYIDPQFVDTGANDYTLQPTSPCVDAGHPAWLHNDPDGTRNDVGALYLDLGSTNPLAVQLSLGGQGLEVPLHIIGHTPTIYWTFADTAEATAQTAFELEVGTDRDWTVAERWDTGIIASSDTSLLYAGQSLHDGVEYLLRIRLNNGQAWGGWRFMRLKMNQKPSDPVPLSPVDGAVIPNSNIRLSIQNAVDTTGDALSYDFEVYADSQLSSLVAGHYAVAEEENLTHSGNISGLAVNAQYWWRSRANDIYEYSAWCSTTTFYTRQPGGTLRVPEEVLTIQEAIQLATNGDTVLVGPGTYNEHLDFLGKSIRVRSEAGREFTTIRAVQAGVPVVSFITGEDSSSVLEGFEIDAAARSRGIWCFKSGPVVQDCEVWKAYSSESGGGISCVSGTATIRNNDVHHNYASWVGAGILAHESMVVITGNRVHHNSGMRPGIGLSWGPSLISRNILYNNDGTEAQWGAGLWFQGNGHVVVNNTIVGNTRGMASNTGVGTVLNNIVVGNEQEGILVLGASVVNYNDAWNNGSHNTPGPSGFSQDPLFTDAAGHDYSLRWDSPCIDAGDPGQPADPDGSRADIGALIYVALSGDVTGDGSVNAADVVYLVNFVFKAGPPPVALSLGDVNASCSISASDIIYLVNYVFKARPVPLTGCAEPTVLHEIAAPVSTINREIR